MKTMQYPEIPGFCWWQFLTIWPKKYEKNPGIDDISNYDFVNVRLYISMLNPGVNEYIQYVHNKLCVNPSNKTYLSDIDTIHLLANIVQTIDNT
jgi:hypothetical protein